MSESDTHAPRDGQSRELPGASRAEGQEYVLPANVPQSRVSESLNGHALDRDRIDGHRVNGSEAAQRAASAASASWEALFAQPSSSQILARLVDGDPLAIEERCRARIEHLALLVDLERVVQCALANVAFFARRYRGSPPFELWMRQRVEAGIERVLEDEQESERALMNFAAPSAIHRQVAHAMGFDVHLARRACVVVNSLPLTVRRVFAAVVLRREPLEGLSDAQHGAPPVRERRLRTALISIAHLEPMEIHPDDGGLDEE